MIWNILPVDDLKKHVDNSTCECKPKILILDGGDLICVHNSYDGREYKEELIEEIKKQCKLS